MKENDITKYSQENDNNIIPFIDENGKPKYYGAYYS